MFDATVYYCWACDAHRKAVPDESGHARCPRCLHELTDDARLPLRVISAEPLAVAPRPVSPSPIRPRFAASA